MLAMIERYENIDSIRRIWRRAIRPSRLNSHVDSVRRDTLR